ncbi:MAG TPA: nuclear transport factor 2 family protein [Aquabacterium sp.]|nr:nuclear transport factor 2 family protein [Aquabacterium sp.]
MADSRSQKVAKAALMATADDTEAAFYEAMQHADIDRLMAVWSDDDEIACVHPGGPRLVGSVAIRAAFEAVFANGAVMVSVAHVRRIESTTSAVHHVLEKVQAMGPEGLQTAYVLASNVYLRGAQGWRMVLHHASPGQADDMQEMIESSSVLH